MVNEISDWFGTFLWIMTFHIHGNVIIPTDFQSIIFQRGRLNHELVAVQKIVAR